jgi:hypothetical protein
LTRERAFEYASKHVNLDELLKRPEGKTPEFKHDVSALAGALNRPATKR